MTLEKKYKIFFFWKKNEAHISGFTVVKKLQVPENNFFSKKSSSSFFQFSVSSIFAVMTIKKVCRIFFKISGSRDI